MFRPGKHSEYAHLREVPKSNWQLCPLKKGTLELAAAQQGNILSRTTLSLFYATDFADQLENTIIPALKAGAMVLAVAGFSLGSRVRLLYTVHNQPGWPTRACRKIDREQTP